MSNYEETKPEETLGTTTTLPDRLAEMKSIQSTMDEVNDIMKTMHNLMDGILSQYNVTDKILKYMVGLTPETIDTMTSVDIEDFLERAENDRTAINQAYMDYPDKSETLVEFERNALKGIQELYANIKGAELEKMKLISEASKVQKNYLAYIDSDEYKDNKNMTIQKLKDSVSSIDSLYLKNKYLKQLEALETSDSCKFILERFINGDPVKEVSSVENQFFNARLSNTCMERFSAKIAKTGLSGGIYRGLFNLEELFLPEKYHPYNNFFLFYVMRFVAHADMDDKIDVLRVEAIINKLNLLKNDKFQTEQDKEEFINLIKGMYMYVITEERTTRFKEKNTTYKNHPKRLTRHNALVEDFKKELGPEFEENMLENTSDAQIEVSIHKMNSSKIEMCNEIYALTHDTSLTKDPLPFWELKRKFNEFKSNLEIMDTSEPVETDSEDDDDESEESMGHCCDAPVDEVEVAEEFEESESETEYKTEMVESALSNPDNPIKVCTPTDDEMEVIEELVKDRLDEFDALIEEAKTNPDESDDINSIKEALCMAQ